PVPRSGAVAGRAGQRPADAGEGRVAGAARFGVGDGAVGLGFFDRDLRFLRVNDALAMINGLPADEHVGRSLPDLMAGLPDEVSRDIRSVFDTGKPVVNREVSGETPAAPSETRHWLVSYYPVRAVEGDNDAVV